MGKHRYQQGQKRRLPTKPEGEKRDEAVERLRNKLTTGGDVEGILAVYDKTQIRPILLPLMQKVNWLMLPWYKRLFALYVLRPWGWLKKAKGKLARRIYIWRWNRLESRPATTTEEEQDGADVSG